MKVPLLRGGTFHVRKGLNCEPFKFEILPKVGTSKVGSKI